MALNRDFRKVVRSCKKPLPQFDSRTGHQFSYQQTAWIRGLLIFFYAELSVWDLYGTYSILP